ncbi:MAG: GTP-binding protein [Candidatus Lokiarchaeota archaeon]|nr:GTP-binding protein [Candidatus Lokiarchaeota archaeon]
MTQLVKMKICIIGDFATGKTSLIRRYVDNLFARDYRPTIGSNVFIKKIELSLDDESYLVSLNIFEVAGQDRWETMRKTYYSGSQGLIFVGDLSRKRTFYQIQDFWYKDAREYVSETIPTLLIANKCDLQEDISNNDIQQISNRINAFSFLKTSAKENIQIDKAFFKLVETVLKASVNMKVSSTIITN